MVWSRINQNTCKQKLQAAEMNLVLRTVSCIFCDDLGVKSYKKYTGHLLDACLKCIRLERLKALKLLSGKELF